MEMMKTIRQRLHETIFPKEIVDPVPVHIPGDSAPLTLREEMRRYIREEVSRGAALAGADSFDEENDFEPDDGEPDLTTPYTVNEMQQPMPEVPKDDLDGHPVAEDTKDTEEKPSEELQEPPVEPKKE